MFYISMLFYESYLQGLLSRKLFIEHSAALRGKTHHFLHRFHVVRFHAAAQLFKLALKRLYFGNKHILVEHKKLAPHILVYARDTREVAEGVARVTAEVCVVVAGHERNCNAVRKLGKKRYHSVVLLRGDNGNVCKAEHFAKRLARFNSIFRVARGGRYYVVCALEHIGSLSLPQRKSPAHFAMSWLNSAAAWEYAEYALWNSFISRVFSLLIKERIRETNSRISFIFITLINSC